MLLLNTSQFEFILKNMFQELLSTKRAKWDEYKKESKERMTELSEYFSGIILNKLYIILSIEYCVLTPGEKALTRIKKDEHLQGWFTNLAVEIEAIDFDKSIVAGRKVVYVVRLKIYN